MPRPSARLRPVVFHRLSVLRWRPFFCQFLERPRHGRVSWAQEIWPFQWRIAVSWMSGYFVFDIINPIAFYFCGPVAAGRLGMSFQVVRMITNVSLTWIYTKAPPFGMLIAARAWSELERSGGAAPCSLRLLPSGVGAFLAAVPLAGHFVPRIPARLAPFPCQFLVGGAMPIQVLVGAMAMELRAHKREPFMWVSFANAVLSVAFILPLVRVWGITGEALGFALAIWAIFIPAVLSIESSAWNFEAMRSACTSRSRPFPILARLPAGFPSLKPREIILIIPF